MKLLKVVLVLFVLLVNLVFTPPSLADTKTPKYDKNPDYIEIAQSLNALLKAKENPGEAEKYTPEELDQKIADLEFQKYTLETGINWGQCRNETGKTLAVYGPNPKKSKSTYDKTLYFLGAGQITEPEWDCDGVYIPTDAVTNLTTDGQTLGAVAVKIVDGTQLVVKTNPDTGVLELNPLPAKIFKSGEVNWFIPNVSQVSIDTRVPNASIQDPTD
jgi:hypothetical protein